MINIPESKPEFYARYETLPYKQKLVLKLFLLGFDDPESARLDLTFEAEQIALILISLCPEEISLLFNFMSKEQSEQIQRKLNNQDIIERLPMLRENPERNYLKPAKDRIRKSISNAGEHFGFRDLNVNQKNYYVRENLVTLFWQYKSELVNSSRLTEYGLDFLPSVRNFVNEEKWENYIKEPGSLVRIRSPRLMGKTFLINNLLRRLQGNQQYKIVYFTFNSCDSSVLFDYQTLIKFFSESLIEKMGLNHSIMEEWDEILNSLNQNMTILLEKCLSLMPENLILVLDDFHKIYELPYYQDFCSLLRGFFDNSRCPQEKIHHLWEKLHLVIAHSTDIYATLDINISPLANLGEIIHLEPFTIDEIRSLSKQYNLAFKESEFRDLYNLINGHPYLVTLTFNHLKNHPEETLKDIIKSACHQKSIYSSYLRGLLAMLKQSENLINDYGKIIGSTTRININDNIIWKLDSLGLIKEDKTNKITYFCDLYRRYFQENS